MFLKSPRAASALKRSIAVRVPGLGSRSPRVPPPAFLWTFRGMGVGGGGHAAPEPRAVAGAEGCARPRAPPPASPPGKVGGTGKRFVAAAGLRCQAASPAPLLFAPSPAQPFLRTRCGASLIPGAGFRSALAWTWWPPPWRRTWGLGGQGCERRGRPAEALRARGGCVAKWSANVCDGGAASLPGRS